jgi:hypothetical protein
MITKLPSVVRIAEGEDLDVSCLITGRLFLYDTCSLSLTI